MPTRIHGDSASLARLILSKKVGRRVCEFLRKLFDLHSPKEFVVLSQASLTSVNYSNLAVFAATYQKETMALIFYPISGKPEPPRNVSEHHRNFTYKKDVILPTVPMHEDREGQRLCPERAQKNSTPKTEGNVFLSTGKATCQQYACQ